MDDLDDRLLDAATAADDAYEAAAEERAERTREARREEPWWRDLELWAPRHGAED